MSKLSKGGLPRSRKKEEKNNFRHNGAGRPFRGGLPIFKRMAKMALNYGGLFVKETDDVPHDEIWVEGMDGQIEKSKIGGKGEQQKGLNQMVRSMKKDLKTILPKLTPHEANMVCNFVKKFFIRQDEKLNLRTIARDEKMDDMQAEIDTLNRKLGKSGVIQGRIYRKLIKARGRK